MGVVNEPSLSYIFRCQILSQQPEGVFLNIDLGFHKWCVVLAEIVNKERIDDLSHNYIVKFSMEKTPGKRQYEDLYIYKGLICTSFPQSTQTSNTRIQGKIEKG